MHCRRLNPGLCVCSGTILLTDLCPKSFNILISIFLVSGSYFLCYVFPHINSSWQCLDFLFCLFLCIFEPSLRPGLLRFFPKICRPMFSTYTIFHCACISFFWYMFLFSSGHAIYRLRIEISDLPRGTVFTCKNIFTLLDFLFVLKANIFIQNGQVLYNKKMIPFLHYKPWHGIQEGQNFDVTFVP